MLSPRLEAIVRQFRQNGLKLLLEDPSNVQDLLALLEVDWLEGVEFAKMVRDPTSYVQRDYRHVEADIVLHAPWRPPGKPRSRQQITLYILIEHQSAPDMLMVFRVLEYVVQIYKVQHRRRQKRQGISVPFQFQPVVPMVFYTGTRRWKSLGQMADLVAQGERFRGMIPEPGPLFINLQTLAPERLETAGGHFGWLLRLLQERHTQPEEFRDLVVRVVEHLETMPAADQQRWQELLSYISALVYHDRHQREHATLQAAIESSVQAETHRQEVRVMGQSMAEYLEEKGRKKGKKEGRQEGEIRARQQMLIRQLTERFGELQPEIISRIKATKDVKQLDTWLIRLVKAIALTDVGIDR